MLESDMDLHQQRAAIGPGPTDVRISMGTPVPSSLPTPRGEVLLELAGDDGPWYTAVRQRDDYLLRLHESCDIQISGDLGSVVVRRASGAPEGLDVVLTTGAMLAFQLYLRGHLVLHASAVDIGGTAVAFVGSSGMGKSTMATLMCAGGGRLITDDVLRVDDEEGTPRARLGATELRLRKGADGLSEAFVRPPGRRTSADRRQVLRLPDDAEDRLPIGAIVIPEPFRGAATLSVEEVPRKEALLMLLGFPRLVGWRDTTVLRRQFEATAALVDRVPVLLARVPWGPPFAPDLAARLSSALRPYSGRAPVEPSRS